MNIITRLKNNDFERHSILFFSFSMIANICNYLYQIIMGNLLSLSDYGTLNTLLSLTVVISIPAGVAQFVTTKYTAGYCATNRLQKIAALLRKVLLSLACFSLLLMLIGTIISGYLARLLNIDYPVLVVGALSVVAMNAMLPAPLGALQGLKRFISMGFASIISTFIKLALGVAFVLLGYSLLGNLAALFIAGFMTFCFELFMLKDITTLKTKSKISFSKDEINNYIKNIFFIQLLTAIVMNGDILLIRVYVLSANEVGIYSSAMVIGKIAMYLSGAIITVLFPMVAEQKAKGEDTRKLFYKAILYGGGMALLCGTCIILFAKPIISVLFGERYFAATTLFVPVFCLIIPVTLISILTNYVSARGTTLHLTVSLTLGIALIMLLTLLFHNNIPQILYIMGSILTLVFAVNIPFVMQKKDKV